MKEILRKVDPTIVILFFYIFSFCCTILYGSYQFFFGDPVTLEEYTFGQPVVLLWLLLPVVMFFIRAVVRNVHRDKNLNKLEQCRNFMLITLGGFAFFGSIPRISAVFCGESFVNYIICVSLGGIFFFTIFYFILTKSCRITLKWTDRRSAIFLLIHFFVLYSENFRLVSLLFSLICAMSTIEFFNVWKGKIEMTDEDEDEELEWLLVPQASRFKCNMCHKKYNRTTRIPRILKECGHTICEECGDELWNENTGTLQCPFCQIVTSNKGPANLLPKNFAVMGTVELNSSQNLIDV